MLMLQLWMSFVKSNGRYVGRQYLMTMNRMMYTPMTRALAGTRPRDNNCASSHMTPRRIPLGAHSVSNIVDNHTTQLIRIRPEFAKTAGRRSSRIGMTFPSFTAITKTSNALCRIPPERRTIPRSHHRRTFDPRAILTKIDARLHTASAIR